MGETNEDVYIFHGMINNERFQIITGQNKNELLLINYRD